VWWYQDTQRQRWPRLSLMAIDILLILPRAIGWGAMPSWPMIEYQADTWCLLVKRSSSHVGLAL
jgi:hypothetical protein